MSSAGLVAGRRKSTHNTKSGSECICKNQIWCRLRTNAVLRNGITKGNRFDSRYMKRNDASRLFITHVRGENDSALEANSSSTKLTMRLWIDEMGQMDTVGLTSKNKRKTRPLYDLIFRGLEPCDSPLHCIISAIFRTFVITHNHILENGRLSLHLSSNKQRLMLFFNVIWLIWGGDEKIPKERRWIIVKDNVEMSVERHS